MAKIKNNPLLKGLSGMLGDVVVFRETRGKMTMSNRPKKRGVPTDHQKLSKAKFLQAVQYAKGQMKDPVSKAEYEAAVSDKVISAYGVAVADYLKGPEITLIDVSGYQGKTGDPILINAIDNFKVTEVQVTIQSSVGIVIEEGPASQSPINGLSWQYVAKVADNTPVAGRKIVVSAKDKPDNTTIKELVIT
jgi:hypothetical protein